MDEQAGSTGCKQTRSGLIERSVDVSEGVVPPPLREVWSWRRQNSWLEVEGLVLALDIVLGCSLVYDQQLLNVHFYDRLAIDSILFDRCIMIYLQDAIFDCLTESNHAPHFVASQVSSARAPVLLIYAPNSIPCKANHNLSDLSPHSISLLHHK